KALPHGDEAAVQQALDDIWDEAAGHFTPCSADVLSAIAVAASSSSMSDAFRTRVAERLIMTSQRRLQDSGQQLPRRALKFVNAVQSREKQESIRRMLAAQENGA
ncbi:hypothetical protein DQ04_05701000, partial [Trypanosoma grayi]|uniref:hypothetical protein n=1 Tax=Trypanosoma grayi TaxID=71804 RepID=UPI0004F461E0